MGHAWISGKVFDFKSKGPGFEWYWILLVFCESVLKQDTSKPQASTCETKERHE